MKMSKGMKNAPMNQHKRLATGQSLAKPNMKDMGGDMKLSGGMGKGGTISSSGDTGSGYKHGIPKSTTCPDPKGPIGHSVPKSTMTNA